MRPIPLGMRNDLSRDPRMKSCAVAGFRGTYGPCAGKIEWDHVWIYGGKQVNEKWAIVGVCQQHHQGKEGNRLLKEAICRTSLRLATEKDLEKYPRKNWPQLKKSLGL